MWVKTTHAESASALCIRMLRFRPSPVAARRPHLTSSPAEEHNRGIKTKKSSKVLDDGIYQSFRSPLVFGKTVCMEICSGGRTRTSGLRVMSPTSYQLLYPAMWITKVRIISEPAIQFLKYFQIFLNQQQNHPQYGDISQQAPAAHFGICHKLRRVLPLKLRQFSRPREGSIGPFACNLTV